MRIRFPLILAGFSLLLLLAGLAACSSDEDPGDGGVDPIIPELADLSIRFSVYQMGATERLLWKGTADGPDADSPQRTALPQIPGAEPFRVDWELVDSTVPILGFQYRATQDPREGDLRLPRDANDEPVWGEVQSFSYENSTPIQFITSRCPTGGDCPEVLLFGSNEAHTLYVFAATADEQETPESEARLEFEIVNLAPSTELVQDAEYPYWRIDGVPHQSLASGDNIPAGATVVFRMTGNDPDPAVLKLPLPRVRCQGLYQHTQRIGPQREVSTFYSTPSEADTVEFTVGPFNYTFFGRAVDRLRTVDPTPVSFEFHAGFAPRVVAIMPEVGDEVLLRHPDDGTWAQNTVDYGTPQATNRYWIGGRFYETDLPETEVWSGIVFHIPLILTGEADSRESSAAGFGGARAFAYEWFGENDPDNNLHDGGGWDNSGRFSDANFSDEYRLEGDEGIEIFVPNLLWDFPEFFDADTCVSQPGADFCGVGAYLRQQLGQITIQAWARHTANNQTMSYWSNTVENDGPELSLSVGDWGLVSEVFSESFPLHIGLDDGQGGVVYWPPQN